MCVCFVPTKHFTVTYLPPPQYLYSLKSMSAAEADGSKQAQLALRLTRAEMALETLFNVIHNNPGVEVQCLGHFKLLFSLLATERASKLQLLALKAVSSVTGNRACVLYTNTYMVLATEGAGKETKSMFLN